MDMFLRKHWFKLLVTALCIAIIGMMVYNNNKKLTMPVIFEAVDFQLQNVAEEPVTLGDSAGKVRLVYFFFSNCPDVCIPTTALLGQVRNELERVGLLGDRAQILSITFDPERDTVERLIEFSGRYGAELPGWQFLREPDADEEITWQLAADYQISVFKDPESGQFGHNNRINLVDKHGDVRKTYVYGMAGGVGYKEIVDDMIQLSKER